MCNTSFLHLTNTTLLEIKLIKKAYNKSSDGEDNDSDSKIFFDGCVHIEYVYTMKSLQRNTRLKPSYNPSGELVNIISHHFNVYRRFKRRFK